MKAQSHGEKWFPHDFERLFWLYIPGGIDPRTKPQRNYKVYLADWLFGIIVNTDTVFYILK